MPFSEFEDGGWDRPRGYSRGRGRGRGRNFRGRGRGGYSGPQIDLQHDADGYDQEAPPVEGRGRNYRGRGRGGYGGPPMDVQHDADGYDQEAPTAEGRGKIFYIIELLKFLIFADSCLT